MLLIYSHMELQPPYKLKTGKAQCKDRFMKGQIQEAKMSGILPPSDVVLHLVNREL